MLRVQSRCSVQELALLHPWPIITHSTPPAQAACVGGVFYYTRLLQACEIPRKSSEGQDLSCSARLPLRSSELDRCVKKSKGDKIYLPLAIISWKPTLLFSSCRSFLLRRSGSDGGQDGHGSLQRLPPFTDRAPAPFLLCYVRV